MEKQPLTLPSFTKGSPSKKDSDHKPVAITGKAAIYSPRCQEKSPQQNAVFLSSQGPPALGKVNAPKVLLNKDDSKDDKEAILPAK